MSIWEKKPEKENVVYGTTRNEILRKVTIQRKVKTYVVVVQSSGKGGTEKKRKENAKIYTSTNSSIPVVCRHYNEHGCKHGPNDGRRGRENKAKKQFFWQ